jgi:hypothetical protein
MAKVSFTKLGLKVNQDVQTIEFNEQNIEVKQYLPVSDKLELISNVINASADANNFANPVKISVFTTLEIFYFYTNINFTDKQKEDPIKLYDMLISSGLAAEVIKAIPEVEHQEIIKGIHDSVNAVYNYRSSVLGIMEAVMADYSNVQMDANSIAETLKDEESLTLVKDIVAKLG